MLVLVRRASKRANFSSDCSIVQNPDGRQSLQYLSGQKPGKHRQQSVPAHAQCPETSQDHPGPPPDPQQ